MDENHQRCESSRGGFTAMGFAEPRDVWDNSTALPLTVQVANAPALLCCKVFVDY